MKKDPRLALIIGPCSIHDFEEALEYARRLQELSLKIGDLFYIVMRVFVEKPRTKTGWKGFLYDPFLDGSYQIEQGIALTRKLLIALAEMRVPAATEFVDPLFIPYFDDLITWGFIGARTSSSQIHRQAASGLHFPVGFKNSIDGNIDVALDGVESASTPHSHVGISDEGNLQKIRANGNPYCHLVLRGSEQKSNFDPYSVQEVLKKIGSKRFMIDCSHGNSGRIAERQKISFQSVIQQALGGNESILGMMLESYLQTGKQNLTGRLKKGLSITDSCLGWEETESLLLEAHSLTSISSVQN